MINLDKKSHQRFMTGLMIVFAIVMSMGAVELARESDKAMKSKPSNSEIDFGTVTDCRTLMYVIVNPGTGDNVITIY